LGFSSDSWAVRAGDRMQLLLDGWKTHPGAAAAHRAGL
jgi:hypothetical protein